MFLKNINFNMCVFFKYKLKSIKLFGAEMKPHELLRKRQFLKKGGRTCSLPYAKSVNDVKTI